MVRHYCNNYLGLLTLYYENLLVDEHLKLLERGCYWKKVAKVTVHKYVVTLLLHCL